MLKGSAHTEDGQEAGGSPCSAQPAAGPGRLWVPTPNLPSGHSVPTFRGQVLLSLSDEDLELGLGVCSSLHRRKLRLAIEDYRDAEAGRR